MPAISRDLIDLAYTGHGCMRVAPAKATQGSVFANNKPVLRQFDPLVPHLIRIGIKCVIHTHLIWGASPNVFAEGRGVARKYDKADIKGFMSMGSRNVYANGAGGLAGAIIGAAVSAGVGKIVSGLPSPGSTGPGGSDVMGST